MSIRRLVRAVPLVLVIGALPWLVPAGVAQSRPAPARPVESILAEIKARDRGELAVSEEDGRFLRVLAASSRAKRALEIGAASGYSAIWIGLGLRQTGGRLITIEYDQVRAREARENVRRAGLDDIIQVVAGDAFAEIPRIQGTFGLVFLDAWKRDYSRFFTLIFPRLDVGGLFLAHNVVNKRDQMPEFLAVVQRHPALWTTVVAPSGEGMSISYRTR